MLVLNPTIQLAYLYTKYEPSILNDCGDIFELRTEGMTDRYKPVYLPLFQRGGGGGGV